MLHRRLPLAAFALAVTSLLAIPAHATVLVAMSIEDLAVTSDAIVVARVIATEPRRTPQGIVTHVTLQVSDWWAGAGLDGTRGATLELCVHGGRIGNEATHVDGQAVFTQGEEVVVFLFRGGNALWPQGMSQGKWLLRRDAGAPEVASQADLASLVTRDAHGALVPVAPFARPTLGLAELHARVLAARGQ